MKKRNLFLTVLVAALFVGCSKDGDKIEVIPIENISDLSFRDYILERFDLDGDGEIDVDEAKTVTEIDIAGKNIESLNGIEHFTSLKKLVCSRNRLTTLNLEKNTELEMLDCSDNSSLTKIDIGKNVKLRVLDCGSCNLSTLNLQNNPELEELNCQGNNDNITSIDLSKNTKLKDRVGKHRGNQLRQQ